MTGYGMENATIEGKRLADEAIRYMKEMEKNNIRFQAKYRVIEENEVRFEEIPGRPGKRMIQGPSFP